MLARNRAMAACVLLSGDEDLRVGVQQAQEYGIRVYLLGIRPSRGSQSSFLREEADRVGEWTSAELSAFLACNPRPPDLAGVSVGPDRRGTSRQARLEQSDDEIDERPVWSGLPRPWLSPCLSRRPSRLPVGFSPPAGADPKSTEGYWPCRAARSAMTWISSRRAPCAVRSSQRWRSAWWRPRQADGRTAVFGGMLESFALPVFADTCIAP